MHHMRMSHRIRYAAALAAVGLVTSAGTASAHHCYKDEWTAQAYENLAASGKAWMTLSDLGTMFMVAPDEVAVCGPLIDQAVYEWMDWKGLEVEPLIHSKAIVGGGAFHNKGKAPKPFEYMTEEDFGMVIGAAIGYMMEAGCTLPPMED